MEFSRPELPFPPPGDLPNPGIEPRSPASQVHSLLAEPQGNLGRVMVDGTGPEADRCGGQEGSNVDTVEQCPEPGTV